MTRAFALLALALAACTDAGTGVGSLTGTYTLRTINGDPVPATLAFTSPSDHVELLEGQIRLASDGTYSDRTRVQETKRGVTTEYLDDTQGRWSVSGTALLLVDDADAANATRGVIGGGRITITGYGGTSAVAEFTR